MKLSIPCQVTGIYTNTHGTHIIIHPSDSEDFHLKVAEGYSLDATLPTQVTLTIETVAETIVVGEASIQKTERAAIVPTTLKIEDSLRVAVLEASKAATRCAELAASAGSADITESYARAACLFSESIKNLRS